MRREVAPVAVAACLLGCSEWRLKPTFPEHAAGKPVLYEQAILGISDEGSALVAQLVSADGEGPHLSLLLYDRGGAPTRGEMVAPAEAARAVADQVLAEGRRPAPLLGAAVASHWPQALAHALDLRFSPRAPAVPEPGRQRFIVAGAPENGSLPLALRLDESDPSALVLLLSAQPAGESGEEVELARAMLVGTPVAPQLFIRNGVAWVLAGSVLEGEPLHRALGVRRGSIARGEAQLHNNHGLADYAAGDLDAARREFDRAIAADPGFVDSLYNAAAAAALADRAEEAVALLRRAAAVDLGRVQVLGRNDDDLKILRRRADVRALLGLKRPPREDIPPPP
jgi:tetratricopeptide (TPR) repeat protein